MNYKYLYTVKDIVKELKILYGVDTTAPRVSYWIHSRKLEENGLAIRTKAKFRYYKNGELRENYTEIFKISEEGKTILIDIIKQRNKEKKREKIVCKEITTPIEELAKAKDDKTILQIKLNNSAIKFLELMKQTTGKKEDEYINNLLLEKINGLFKEI